MPIQTACTHCDASYNLPDDKAGKTVRCKKCEKTFTVVSGGGKSNGATTKGKDALADKVQAKGPQRKVNSRRGDDDDDEDNDDDKGKGKGKKKKGKAKNNSSTMTIMVAAGGGGLLLLAGVIIWIFMANAEPASEPAKSPKPKDTQVAQGDGGKKGDAKGDGKGDKKGGKGDKKGADKGDPKGGDKGAKIDVTPEKKPEETKDYPPLAPDDPIWINYEKLRLDRQVNTADVKAAAEFFLRTDPCYERDVHGFLFGFKDRPCFKDHPWRGLVAKRLELLIDHEDFLKSKLYWEAYARWVTVEDFDQLLIHQRPSRAGEHRPLLLARIADFRTPEACELIVECLNSSQKKEAIRHIKDLGGHLCLNLIFPYVWHPDYEMSELGKDLVLGFGLDVDHRLYEGPVDALRTRALRLPKPHESERHTPLLHADELTLDLAIQILSGAGGGGATNTQSKDGGWRSDERFRKLITLGWLQDQRLSSDHWNKMSAALDKLVTLHDYHMKSNAFICLERWVTDGNLATLSSCYEKESGALKTTSLNLMKRIPSAEGKIIAMWPKMDSALLASQVEWMLSVNEEASKKALVGYFNHKNFVIQATAREAAKKWNVDQETLMELCMKDTGGKDTQISALGWLKSQQPPLNEGKRKQYVDKIEALAKPPSDPKKVDDLAEVRTAARQVLLKWGAKESPETWVAILESPEFSGPNFRTTRQEAMRKLVNKKYAPGVAAIAMYYKNPIDKNEVVDCLRTLGPAFCDPNLKEAFERADSTPRKIELLKVMELICTSRDVYQSLEATLKQEPPISGDLAIAIRAAMKNMDARLKSAQ